MMSYSCDINLNVYFMSQSAWNHLLHPNHDLIYGMIFGLRWKWDVDSALI